MYGILKKNYSCKQAIQIFLNFRQDVKNDVLTSILSYFCQKFGHGMTLLIPPLPIGFSAITDHLITGRSPARPWSAVWCSTSQHSSQFPVPDHAVGGGGFSVRPALLLFLSGHWRCTLLGKSRNRSTL